MVASDAIPKPISTSSSSPMRATVCAVDHSNVQRLALVADALQFFLHVGCIDHMTCVQVAEVQDDFATK